MSRRVPGESVVTGAGSATLRVEGIGQEELEQLDARSRELALDPRRSILLQAPAGSGKTTVLTQRLLRLLAEVDEPEEILAITFTRKAAGEMRERVFQALRGQTNDSTAQGRRMRELAEAVRERSRALGWALEAHPGRLRIQTMDSLNRWLARHLPVASRAIGNLEVIERPVSLYRLAARRALIDAEADEDLRPDVEYLFDRLDNDFDRFERLLTTMLAVRAHWLPRLLRNAEPGIGARIEESLRAIITDRLQAARAVIPERIIARGVEIALAVAARYHAEGQDGSHAWQVWMQADVTGVESLELAHWQTLCRIALTEKGTWRSVLTRRDGFPAQEKALKAQAIEWIAELSAVSGAQEVLIELAALPDARLPQDDARALECLARVLHLAAAELEIVFQESGRVDYPYISAAARRALMEEGAPSDLGLRLGSQIRHILVDEFQDTSIEQFELLEALTAGWDEGDGRTLFVVGDPMQSIYQFREAEVGLFLRTRERGLGTLRLEPLALTRNFRSLPALVDWTNRIFPRVFPSLDDPRTSAVRYLPSVSSRKGGKPGLVQLHRTRAGDVVGEARAIAALVSRMRAEDPGSSIAILVSARTHAGPIATALQEAGIAVAGVDLVSLAELSVVRDLSALTRALDHLGDRTAWLAVLRAPWCGLRLPELSVLADGPAHMTILEAMRDEQRIGRLDEDARARLVRTRQVLEEALAERDRLDLARWVERTWWRLGGPAACANEADLEHARAYFAALERWSSEPDWTGPLDLDERLSELFAAYSSAPADAVQIMTIHRAKGLEFDKVIVPGLGRRLRSTPEPLLRWLELPRDPDGSDLLMAPIPRSDRRGVEPLNEYLRSLQARRAAHERARLLYVAATRARDELHLFGELPEADGEVSAPSSGTLLSVLWPAVADDFPTEPEGSPSAAEPQQVRRPCLRRLPADWQLPAIEPGPQPRTLAVATYEPTIDPEFSWATETARFVSKAVYEQFRRLARRGSLPSHSELDELRRSLHERLGRMGLSAQELDRATGQAFEAIRRCMDDERIRWLFSRSHRQVRGPLELTGLYEGRLVSESIDRSFVDAQGTRWVVNFCAGSAQEGASAASFAAEVERQRARLARCMALLRAQDGSEARGLLFFPETCELIEPEI